MSEYNFPEILPIGKRGAEPEWERWEFDDWLEENMHRFLFTLSDIRGGAVEFRYADRSGPSTAGIYFLQCDGDVVYVGRASNISDRLRAHCKSNKPWTHFWCITGIPVEILNEIEYMYIAWLKPILNQKCHGWTDIADRLIADLEPYRPFDRIEIRPGVWRIA